MLLQQQRPERRLRHKETFLIDNVSTVPAVHLKQMLPLLRATVNTILTKGSQVELYSARSETTLERAPMRDERRGVVR